jgi:DNA-binding MarR family transcriptional regulator
MRWYLLFAERDGLIRCELDPADGRQTRALLTARARDLEGDLVAAACEVNAAASSGLSARDVTAFLHTMAVIIDNLDAAAGHATSPRRPQPSRVAPNAV